MKSVVHAGTIGWGVWSSADCGESWQPAFRGLNMECRAWTLSWHPAEPGVLWAGTDMGILRQSEDGSATHIRSPADGKRVWALAQSPHDPQILLAGTHPGALYKTDDGGLTWAELPTLIAEECLIGKPRVTRIRFDPIDEGTYWVSVEIDAVHVSRDHGESWRKLDNGFEFPDIHDLVVFEQDSNRRLLAATALGLYSSEDEGESWHWHELDSPWQYTRGIELKSSLDGTVFLGNGNGPPGSKGRLLKSDDWGETWEGAKLPATTNSTVWSIATNSADPDLVYACTNLGQMFRSSDGGSSWNKLPREFGEIRCMLWHPM